VALVAAAVVFAGSCSSGDRPPPDGGSVPEPECRTDLHCPLSQICDLASGKCIAGCRDSDARCPAGEQCVDGQCQPIPDSGSGGSGGSPVDAGLPLCPRGMRPVAGRFCMDVFEASRTDATEQHQGYETTEAKSRRGVLPWYPVDKATAAAACAAAGKRLCTPDEFGTACQGHAGTVYAYGDEYDTQICNGIDTFCYCDVGSPCEGISPCPYPRCFNQPPPGQSSPATGCGSFNRSMPTGSFPDCRSSYGIYDINGNLWELVDDGSATGQFRGGAFNCLDSVTLHRCDYVGGNISAKGFRCCL